MIKIIILNEKIGKIKNVISESQDVSLCAQN